MFVTNTDIIPPSPKTAIPENKPNKLPNIRFVSDSEAPGIKAITILTA